MEKILFALLLSSQVLWAQEVNQQRIKSDIQSAIVYLDGAEVMRSKTLDLKQGKNELVFEGLTSRMNPKTIRLNAPAGVDILSISTRINYLSIDDENPQVQRLRDSVELLQNNVSMLNDEKGAYEQERELLLANKSIGGQDKGVMIADLKAAADFYRSRLTEINRKISQLIRQSQLYNRELVKINQQLSEINNKNSIQRGEITILVNVPTAMKAPLELRYLVTDAGWIPAYDIKATEISQPIQLIYRAKVYNNTDINWKNVRLTLSSADPNLSASKPSMSPWYLSYRQSEMAPQNAYSQQAQEPSSIRGARSGESQTFIDGLKVQNAPMQSISSPLPPAQNTFQRGDLTFTNIAISDINAEFVIEEKYSIPSDAKPYFIRIKEYELPATYKHYTIPKQSCDAFLLARITGWEDLDILEGMANIYLNGTFTGQSFINTREVDDTLDLSLGRDNNVLVHRKKQMEFNSSKLIGSNRKETFAYEIVVKNNHKVAVNIEVIDQLPVPQDSDIEVEKIELSGATHNELSGELRWNYNIAPAEAKKINLSFAIKYPKSRPINTRTTKFRTVRYL